MVRIIVTIVLLLVLAVLVVLNVENMTSVNVFGWRIEQISVVAVGIVSFVGGALYSFFIYLASYLRRKRREKLGQRETIVEEQEREFVRQNAAAGSRSRGLLGLFRSRKEDTGAEKDGEGGRHEGSDDGPERSPEKAE